MRRLANAATLHVPGLGTAPPLPELPQVRTILVNFFPVFSNGPSAGQMSFFRHFWANLARNPF